MSYCFPIAPEVDHDLVVGGVVLRLGVHPLDRTLKRLENTVLLAQVATAEALNASGDSFHHSARPDVSSRLKSAIAHGTLSTDGAVLADAGSGAQGA